MIAQVENILYNNGSPNNSTKMIRKEQSGLWSAFGHAVMSNDWVRIPGANMGELEAQTWLRS